MTGLKEIIFSLKRSVKNQNFEVQLIILREMCTYLEALRGEKRQMVLRRLNHFDLPLVLQDVICARLEILEVSSRALCHLSEVSEFWEYFPLVLQNLTRALISIGRSNQFEFHQEEFVETVLAVDVLLQRSFKAPTTEGSFMQIRIESLLKLIENTLKNERIIFCTKLSTFFLFFHILKIVNRSKERKCAQVFNECFKVGHLLIEFLQKEVKPEQNSPFVVALLKLLTSLLGFLNCSDYKSSDYQKHFLEAAFIRSLKKILLPCILSSAKTKCLVIAFLSTLNMFLASKTSLRFKVNIFQCLRHSKTIEKLVQYLKSECRNDDLLSYQIRILIIELVLKINLEEGNAYTTLDGLRSCSAIFSEKFKSFYSFIISGQCLPQKENFAVENDGTFFNLAFAYIRENSSFSKEFLIQALTGCYNIIKRIYETKTKLETQHFWTGLNLFSSAVVYLGVDSHLEQIKCISDIFNELLPQYMEFDYQLPPLINREVLIWLKYSAHDNNLFQKLLPLYLRKNLSERNLRIGTMLTTWSLIYLLVSNNPNQIKNSFLILMKKDISFHEIEFLLQYACNQTSINEKNWEAILSILFNSAGEFNKTQKIVFCNKIKEILDKKSISSYSKEFYVFLVYVSLYFIDMP